MKKKTVVLLGLVFILTVIALLLLYFIPQRVKLPINVSFDNDARQLKNKTLNEIGEDVNSVEKTDFDFSECLNFTEGSFEWVYCVTTYYPKSLNVEFCNRYSDDFIKDACYANLGVAHADISICQRISDLQAISQCYSGVAKATSDLELCDKIYYLLNQSYEVDIEESIIQCKLRILFSEQEYLELVDYARDSSNIKNYNDLTEVLKIKLLEKDPQVLAVLDNDISLKVLEIHYNPDLKLLGFILLNNGSPLTIEFESSVLRDYKGNIDWQLEKNRDSYIKTGETFVILSRNVTGFPAVGKGTFIDLTIRDIGIFPYWCVPTALNPNQC